MADRTPPVSAYNAVSRRHLVLAIATGILLALSFPVPSLSFLAWIAFVPLLLAIGKKTPRDTFRLAFIGGLTASTGLLYWLNIVMTTYGKLHWTVSFTLFVILSAYLALYPAFVLYLARRAERSGISLLVSFPFLWVALEYARGQVLTGFPWASLGYSQYRTLPLIQVADVTGVYGLSFLIVFANVVIFMIIRAMASKETAGYPTKSAFLLLAMLVATLGYGFERLRTPERGEPLKVALAQGNIPQEVKWDPAFQEQTIAAYERLSRQSCAEGCDLVVWPESAAPFYFQNDIRYAARIRGLAAELKTHILFGSPAFEQVGTRRKFLNSAFLLGPDGGLLGRSDKIHLVPFGEYVPLGRLLPFVSKLVVGIGDFSPGKAVPLSVGKEKVGVLICFEGIFPEIARRYVRDGSRILVNITNDSWFGRSSAPHQHLSMTVFRAVENRVPLVRAANTGITAIIDSKGHIRRMTPLFVETQLVGEVKPGEGGSFYTHVGDIFAFFCIAVSAVVAGLSFISSTKNREKRS